jgi:hypothetical protein
MPPLRLLEFPTDIIEHISSHVPASDLSAWRLTCRELGEAAAPFRLRDLTLYPNRVAGASQYIVKFPASALHIRRLCLGCYFDEDMPSVRLLLDRAKNVKHLILDLQCPISIEVVRTFRYLQNLKLSGILFEDLINLFRTPVSTLLSLAVTWKQLYKPVVASQFMSLLQQGAPSLQILDTSLDMREPLGPISVLPGIHKISLHRSFGINTMNLLSIFPGMRSLATHTPRERYTPTTQPLCVMKSPQLDVLAGDIEGLSWLHPDYMRATLLEVNGNPERPSALSHILAGVRPEMLHLTSWSFDSLWHRLRALPQVQMPSVVVLQLALQCTCGAADNYSSVLDTFHWVRLGSLFPVSVLTTPLSETRPCSICSAHAGPSLPSIDHPVSWRSHREVSDIVLSPIPRACSCASGHRQALIIGSHHAGGQAEERRDMQQPGLLPHHHFGICSRANQLCRRQQSRSDAGASFYGGAPAAKRRCVVSE